MLCRGPRGTLARMRGDPAGLFWGWHLLPSRWLRQGAGHRRTVHRELRTRRGRGRPGTPPRTNMCRGRQAERLPRPQPPAWLRRKLPHDVVVEVDACPRARPATSSWRCSATANRSIPTRPATPLRGTCSCSAAGATASVIGRQGEHGDGPRSSAGTAVETNRSYQFTITRRGGPLDWLVDGQPFLSWTDPEPLTGSGTNIWPSTPSIRTSGSTTSPRSDLPPRPAAMDQPPSPPSTSPQRAGRTCRAPSACSSTRTKSRPGRPGRGPGTEAARGNELEAR